ncbi:MAG: hypothetical protein LBL71_02475 [Endomicrobium sp.]|nr:hypothetical protein [Endomicrobium sp.]
MVKLQLYPIENLNKHYEKLKHSIDYVFAAEGHLRLTLMIKHADDDPKTYHCDDEIDRHITTLYISFDGGHMNALKKYPPVDFLEETAHHKEIKSAHRKNLHRIEILDVFKSINT